MHYTQRSISKPFQVVGRYQVKSLNEPLSASLSYAKTLAAKDGADAIVVDGAAGASSTMVSWILLFIPVTAHIHVIEVKGIRYEERV